MEIIITEYTENHRSDLVRCIEALQKYTVESDPLHLQTLSAGYSETYTLSLLKAVAEKEGKIYFATAAEKIVGFIAGTIQPQTTGGTLESVPSHPAWIRELYIDPDMRGQGVGSLLIQSLEAYFKSKGCDIVQVGVFAPSKEAHVFYESKGYADREITMLKKI